MRRAQVTTTKDLANHMNNEAKAHSFPPMTLLFFRTSNLLLAWLAIIQNSRRMTSLTLKTYLNMAQASKNESVEGLKVEMSQF